MPSAKGDGCSVRYPGSRSLGNPASKVAGRQPSGAVGMGTHCDYERRGLPGPVATKGGQGMATVD